MINNIQDLATRNAINALSKRLDRIENIPQVSKATTLSQLIDIVNKIIAKDKRR